MEHGAGGGRVPLPGRRPIGKAGTAHGPGHKRGGVVDAAGGDDQLTYEGPLPFPLHGGAAPDAVGDHVIKAAAGAPAQPLPVLQGAQVDVDIFPPVQKLLPEGSVPPHRHQGGAAVEGQLHIGAVLGHSAEGGPEAVFFKPGAQGGLGGADGPQAAAGGLLHGGGQHLPAVAPAPERRVGAQGVDDPAGHPGPLGDKIPQLHDVGGGDDRPVHQIHPGHTGGVELFKEAVDALPVVPEDVAPQPLQPRLVAGNGFSQFFHRWASFSARDHTFS